MKNSRDWRIVGLCGILSTLTACSSGSSFVKPGYDFRSVGKVAVLLTMSVGNPAQQQEIADLFARQILRKGYDMIDRSNIADLAREAEFQNASGITSPEGRAKLAIRNVSAVIVVNVSAKAYEVPLRSEPCWVGGYWRLRVGTGYSDPGWEPGHFEVQERPGASDIREDISMTGKMVDVQTGTLLWAGEGTGSLKSGLATFDGALLGARAGAVAGSAIGKTPGVVIGGVADALAGGTVGAALEQDFAQLLRSVIAKTCKGLPARMQLGAGYPARRDLLICGRSARWTICCGPNWIGAGRRCGG